MRVGVPKEIKDHEARVALVPSGVVALKESGHEVLVQAGAGDGSAISDEEYRWAGAEIVAAAGEVWRRADMIVKVKEPQPAEYAYLRPGLILFTYLHLAPLPELTAKLLEARVSGVAYETITESDGSLPLLTPMSEVAGRMSVQVGGQYLEMHNGGRGVLLGGVPGVAPAEVVILGGGIVGTNAAKVALAGARSRHNTYLSVPLIWMMINQHTSTPFANHWATLLAMTAIGWAAVYLLYGKAGKVKGF